MYFSMSCGYEAFNLGIFYIKQARRELGRMSIGIQIAGIPQQQKTPSSPQSSPSLPSSSSSRSSSARSHPTMLSTILAALAGCSLVASAPTQPRATKVQYAGVNIAGFDFGCTTDGRCSLTGTNKPYDIVSGANALGQMNHFVKDDTLNAFRLPVGWQFLVNNNLGGNLDSNNAGQYDRLMQGCLSSGASLCIIDIHNYARWNGQIVGQGGPTDDQLASVWKQLATKYGSNSKVAFGVMNEPHDIPVSCDFLVPALCFFSSAIWSWW